MGIVLEEADETAFWLELLIDADMVPKQKLRNLVNEASELVRIFAASSWLLKNASCMSF